jgi:hypothetical protein
MKVTYDPEVDVLHILLRNVPVEESDEDKPGALSHFFPPSLAPRCP